MKKKVVQDVIPPKKSIRDVELSSRSKSLTENEKNQIEKIKKPTFERPVLINKSKSINEQAPLRIEPIPSSPIKIPPIPNQPIINVRDVQRETPSRPTFTPPSQAAPSYKPAGEGMPQSTAPTFKSPPPIPPKQSAYNYHFTEPPRKSKKWVYISSTILILAGAFGVSTFFRSAEIRVTPKQDSKVLNETLTANKDAAAPALGFQTVTVTQEVEKNLDPAQATSQQSVSKKARGNIVIYNNTSSPQKLVATTRFLTPEGLIFRLVSPVSVPGQVTKSGKTVPGSVEVTVEADKAGPDYNIGLKDFTLPGLKGDPKYTLIYGRSKTEMTGGFVGTQKTYPKALLDSTSVELDSSLRDTLSKNITSQIPGDFIFYPESISYKLDAINQSDGPTSSIVKKKGTATAMIFQKGSLTSAIMGKIMGNSDTSMIKISNLKDMQVSIQNSSSTITETTSQITFNVKGTANLVWVFDENKLKLDLLGLSKQNAKTVISTYGSIKEAWIVTSPFWNQTVPNDPTKVKLINTLTK